MILLYLDIILRTRKTLLSTILLLFTRYATSNASRHSYWHSFHRVS